MNPGQAIGLAQVVCCTMLHDSCAHRVSPETQGPFVPNNDVTVFGSTMACSEPPAVYNRATARGPLTGYRQRLLSFRNGHVRD
jgi:hypothetical protein